MGGKHPEPPPLEEPEVPEPAPPRSLSDLIRLLWVTQQAACFKQFSHDVRREVCQYLTGYTFSFVFKNQLKTYNTMLGETKSVLLPFTFTVASVFCPIDSMTLLCLCGNDIKDPSVFSLNMGTGELTEEQHMCMYRRNPGVIKHGNEVLVFGGSNGDRALTACEKFVVTAKQWVEMSSMTHSKSNFWPCALADDIYLADTERNSGIVEVYNVYTQSFKTLTLPPLLFYGQSSIGFVSGSDLIFIQRDGQIHKWFRNLTTPPSTFKVDVKRRKNWSVASCLPPQVIGREVYWVRGDRGVIIRFNIDSHAVYFGS